jgi:hypothetical protein
MEIAGYIPLLCRTAASSVSDLLLTIGYTRKRVHRREEVPFSVSPENVNRNFFFFFWILHSDETETLACFLKHLLSFRSQFSDHDYGQNWLGYLEFDSNSAECKKDISDCWSVVSNVIFFL